MPNGPECQSGMAEQVTYMGFQGANRLQVLGRARVAVGDAGEARQHVRGLIGALGLRRGFLQAAELELELGVRGNDFLEWLADILLLAGVLVDIARQVYEGRPIDLGVPNLNAIWQGDANSYALRSFELCESPPRILNVTGPEKVWVALSLGMLVERRASGSVPEFRLAALR